MLYAVPNEPIDLRTPPPTSPDTDADPTVLASSSSSLLDAYATSSASSSCAVSLSCSATSSMSSSSFSSASGASSSCAVSLSCSAISSSSFSSCKNWVCWKCTYSNVEGAWVCGMCDAPHAKAEEWACLQCTFVNAASKNVCAICNERKPAKEGKEEEKVGDCVVCYEKKAKVVVTPCGHLCLCQGCSYVIKAKHMPCPQCRGDILSTCVVFFS